MAWVIEIKASAKREIKNFDKPLQKEITQFFHLLEASENPRQHLIPFTGLLAGYWKKRIGNYRLVIDIQDKQLVIEVIKAGHRSKVYK